MAALEAAIRKTQGISGYDSMAVVKPGHDCGAKTRQCFHGFFC
jgi:hypothetical protein